MIYWKNKSILISDYHSHAVMLQKVFLNWEMYSLETEVYMAPFLVIKWAKLFTWFWVVYLKNVLFPVLIF